MPSLTLQKRHELKRLRGTIEKWGKLLHGTFAATEGFFATFHIYFKTTEKLFHYKSIFIARASL